MAESLYTTQTPGPGLDDLSDLGVDTVGGATATTMTFAVDGTVTHIRFFSTITISGTYTAELWEVIDNTTGTRLAAKSVAAAAVSSAGWNTIAFDTPVAVTTGTTYRPALHNSDGNYVARSGVFSAAAVTNGNITGIQDNAGGLDNGAFRTDSAANAYPNGNGNGASYLVDVLFEEDSGEVSVTAGATLGGLTSTAVVGRTVIATAAAALGSLTAAAAVGVSKTVTATASLGGLTAAATVTSVPGAGARSGGWNSLLDIVRDARDTRDREVSAPPSACWRCGEPLSVGSAGELRCRFDGWQPR